ncbi:MAG TPA: c-type cytochrome [Gammaproteobacteria bacterium]|nr:c-type cytochrome [Gammaproteobacteria bacterium]
MGTRQPSIFTLLTAAMLVGGNALAADGKTTFASTCAACHGSQGQGTQGLAPALRGDVFVTQGKVAEIEDTIQNGRSGAKKKYKDIPMDMPAWHLSAADLKAVVAYIRGDLQKH